MSGTPFLAQPPRPVSNPTVVARRSSWFALLGVGAAALATWLFPRAFPIVAVQDRVDRAIALQRADSFIVAHQLAPDSARRAIMFASNDSLRTFIELGGGGKDSLDALLRGRDAPLFSWQVRAFVPGEASEVQLRLSPDGRVTAFRRVLPDSLTRPSLDSASALALADSIRRTWLGDLPGDWGFVASSHVTRSPSGRVDRTFRWERSDRRVGGAPLRFSVVMAGDLPAEARSYVEIPESFARRYDEMRSSNDLLATFSTLGLMALVVVAAMSLRRYAREHAIRWKPPMVIGAIGGILATAATLNALPAAWIAYDTAMSPDLFRLGGVAVAIVGGAGTMLLLTLTLATAEVLTRQAFPWHLDWWKLWRYRGTREVASRVGGGYVMAAVGFAYVAGFYLVTRTVLDWWVPSEMIDDPNQIATAFPWLAGVALSLQAAVSEEALFRAIPLSLVALWAAPRADRDRWMAAGVVGTALLFGFAHSNYPSWPPYSRGVEIFLEACLWGVLFLRYGLLVPVIAHFLYDLVLFGLFATGGSGARYQLTTGLLGLVLLSPLLAVLWARLRQGGWLTLGGDAYFQGWSPPTPAPSSAPPEPVQERAAAGARTRTLAIALPLTALVLAIATPSRPPLGPAFTASRDRAIAVGDSLVRNRGADPDTWRRLTATSGDTIGGWRRFLEREHAESLATTLASTYAVPSWWVVRYVHTDTSLAERTEEWRARVYPDGRPLDVRHIVPEDAPGASLANDSLRTLATAALRAAGYAHDRLVETDLVVEPRPARRDATITFIDSAVVLPAGASARARVSIAGDEVIEIRRGVTLPETFERETRRSAQTSIAVMTGFGVAAITLVILGVIRGRRRPLLLADDFARPVLLAAGAAIALSMLGSGLQSLPAELSNYDTSMPWGAFLTTIAMTQVVVLVGVLMMWLFWSLTNGLRRREGIPFFAGVSSGRWSDDTVAASCIGGMASAMTLAGQWVRPDGVPASPGTALDLIAPVLAPALAVIPGAVVMVLAVAIPALSVTGFPRKGRVRGAMALLLLALVGGALFADELTGAKSFAVVPLAWRLVSGGGILLALYAWGRVSVLSWLMAALLIDGIGQLRSALAAPTATERAGHGLGLVLIAVLFLAGAMVSRRRAASAAA